MKNKARNQAGRFTKYQPSRDSDAQRFWAKVELIPFHSCWEWMAAKNTGGYGSIRVIENGKARNHLAHRFSWMITKGEIPTGMSVCHKCDNPGCVNPEHLFVGTHQDNMADAKKKGKLTCEHFIGKPPAHKKYFTEEERKQATRILNRDCHRRTRAGIYKRPKNDLPST